MNVSLITLGDPDRLTGGYLYHRKMAELARDNGAALGFVSVPDVPPPLAWRRSSRALISAQDGADVVVLDSIAAAHVAIPLLRRAPRVPLVPMLHQPPGGIDHGPLSSRALAALDVLAYRRAHTMLLASESLKEDLWRRFPGHELIVVAPGRDMPSVPDLDPAMTTELRDGRAAAFLCVANWMARKGIVDLLDALARVPADLAVLHLVGDTDTEARYAARVRRRLSEPDLAGRVIVHGPVPKARVAELYAAADAFVLPSTKEPYGTVYGEAMAAGLPVIGWRAGNLPYLARDGEHGLIVEPGDVAGLATAMVTLARDASLRRRMSSAARTRGSSFPTWDQSARLFFDSLRAARGPRLVP